MSGSALGFLIAMAICAVLVGLIFGVSRLMTNAELRKLGSRERTRR